MLTVNIYYKGDDALDFMREMESSGIADAIRAKKGCLRYDYFISVNDDKTVLLIDSWSDQSALDEHHKSDLMPKIAKLREKYDVHMTVERFISDDSDSTNDLKYIRK